ncbi:hypothetical protein LINGRAHAP2_LOCUS32063 [Linum grandiflorum]
MVSGASSVVVLVLTILVAAAAAAAAAVPLNSGVFYSPTFDMSPGQVVFEYYYGVEFPKGHLALKSFHADVVDAEDDNVVIPYHEVYLHHSYIVSYYQAKNYSIPPVKDIETLPYGDGFIYRRNHGICQGDILGQYFGLGTEMQTTPTNVPDPYGIEIGNPNQIPDGFEEKWLLVVHVIDTRGAVDKLGCAECRVDLYNVTVDQFGQPLKPDYYGGLSCCYAHTKCKVRDGYYAPTRRLRMRYKLTWTEWIPSVVVPVRVYILDITDDIKLRVDPSNGGVTAQHDCRIEYDVERCNSGNDEKCVDVKKSIVAMPKGGNVIFGLTHLHSGAINSTLYGQDGRILCKTEPIYGEGEEEQYVIGMSTCYPEPGSVVINDGELLVHESVYIADRRRTGVMGLFYLLVADPQPQHHNTTSTTTASSNFMRLPSLMSEMLTVTWPEGGLTTGAFVGVGGMIILAAVVLANIVAQIRKQPQNYVPM